MNTSIPDLKPGKLLLATPFFNDKPFEHKAVLLCEIGADGTAWGVQLTEERSVTIRQFLDNWEIQTQSAVVDAKDDFPDGYVRIGGTDRPNDIQAFHSSDYEHVETQHLTGQISRTDSADVLVAYATEMHPQRILVTAGRIEWPSGLLGEQIESGNWTIIDADFDLIFNTRADKLFFNALETVFGESFDPMAAGYFEFHRPVKIHKSQVGAALTFNAKAYDWDKLVHDMYKTFLPDEDDLDEELV